MKFNNNFLSSILFLAVGYTIGKSKEKDIKTTVEEIIKKTKESKENAGLLFNNFLDKLEDIEADELRANLSKWIANINDKLDKFIEENNKAMNKKETNKKEINKKIINKKVINKKEINKKQTNKKEANNKK